MTITVEKISERLATSKEAISLWLKRNGKELNSDGLRALLEAYSKQNNNRPVEVTELANKWLDEILASESINTTETQANTVTDTQNASQYNTITRRYNVRTRKNIVLDRQNSESKPNKFDFDRFMLNAVFVCILLWQIPHTALLEHRVSPFHFLPVWFSVAMAVLFAVGIQFTALLLTKRHAKKVFLRGAAVCEVLINIMLYFEWVGVSMVFISLLAAFAIYSYSELFVDKTK